MALFITFLMLVGSLTPIAGTAGVNIAVEIPDVAEEDEHRVLQPGLGIIMEDADDEDPFEVIVQFCDPADRTTRRTVEDLGFEILRTLPHVDGLFMVGPKSAILGLAERDGVDYIEFNAPLRPYMNASAATISATDVWNRLVLRDDGSEEIIDGAGVTVVVLDSGIDATHPDLEYTPVNIERGDRPEAGDKVIFNAKKNQDVIGEPWLQFIDTDTTSGHGTHCAGTVGGTGGASAGGKRGVAPGAWLIGLSMGELFMTIDEYSGLVWVYDHSHPDDNPANIRVVTNSWGPGWPFDALDPKDASSTMIDKIVNENNVAVVFAAGNDGSDDHDGHRDSTNIFAKVPGAIGVAATTRNGLGLATFTSRGDATMNETWPDIAAPGVGIWSAAARVTMIGAALMGNDIITNSKTDPYYLAISGTSMATPHVAGLVALLWQACPSLTISDVLEEGHTADESDLSPFIHETELILKATADYVEQNGDNGVPDEGEREHGIIGKPYDYAQGYGLVNATKAVGVALMLDKLRDPDHDGEVDDDATVFEAMMRYERIMTEKDVTMRTDVISATWDGEFVHPWDIVDSTLNTSAPLFGRRIPYTGLFRTLYIPEKAVRLHLILDVELEYVPLNRASLYIEIDSDGDGVTDWSPDGEPSIIPAEHKEWYVDIASGFLSYDRDGNWSFNVTGYTGGLTFRNAFTVTVEVILDSLHDLTVDEPAYRFGTRTDEYPGGETTLHLYYYDLRSEKKDDGGDFLLDLLPLVIGLAVAGSAVYFILNRRRKGKVA